VEVAGDLADAAPAAAQQGEDLAPRRIGDRAEDGGVGGAWSIGSHSVTFNVTFWLRTVKRQPHQQGKRPAVAATMV
jgi:hypothetical protein